MSTPQLKGSVRAHSVETCWLEVMNKTPVAIDIETESLDANVIHCFVVAWEHKSVVLPWTDETAKALQEYIYQYYPVFHNAAFDVWALRKHGIDIPDSYYDTMVASYVWNPRRDSHSLQSWGEEFGLLKMNYREACMDEMLIPFNAQKGAEFEIGFNRVMEEYCQRDGEITIKLYKYLTERLATDPKANKILHDVELPFIECIIEMQSTGFYMDVEGSRDMIAQLETGTAEAIEQMRAIVPHAPGKKVKYKKPHDDDASLLPVSADPENKLYVYKKWEPFNPNSGAQVSWALKDVYGWEPDKYTKGGVPCTDAEVLGDLDYPLAQLLVEHAQLDKARGMVQGYMERLRGCRLFGSFNQCVTWTGRLSSSDPNLQNIPTRGDWGSRIRGLFTSPDGYSFVDCDLSNIEGRVLAHYLAKMCGDTRMADTFKAGIDFHQANADAWQVSRSDAKTLLYASLYGAGPAKIGGGNKERGLELLDKLDKNMPALRELKEMTWDACRKLNGVIHTAFGRRLVYPEIDLDYSRKLARREGLGSGAEIERYARGLVSRAERQVFNALLQGSAADCLKAIAIECSTFLGDYDAYLAASVHDELLFYAPETRAAELAERVEVAFSRDYFSHCPIKGDPKVGKTWADVH